MDIILLAHAATPLGLLVLLKLTPAASRADLVADKALALLLCTVLAHHHAVAAVAALRLLVGAALDVALVAMGVLVYRAGLLVLKWVLHVIMELDRLEMDDIRRGVRGFADTDDDEW